MSVFSGLIALFTFGICWSIINVSWRPGRWAWGAGEFPPPLIQGAISEALATRSPTLAPFMWLQLSQGCWTKGQRDWPGMKSPNLCVPTYTHSDTRMCRPHIHMYIRLHLHIPQVCVHMNTHMETQTHPCVHTLMHARVHLCAAYILLWTECLCLPHPKSVCWSSNSKCDGI